MAVRARITLSLNIASLALGLFGAGFAAYPAFSAFHGVAKGGFRPLRRPKPAEINAL
jgi:hypothetical protein